MNLEHFYSFSRTIIDTKFDLQAKAMGRVLFEQVCKQLHLLEADYFGLEYADGGGTKVITTKLLHS